MSDDLAAPSHHERPNPMHRLPRSFWIAGLGFAFPLCVLAAHVLPLSALPLVALALGGALGVGVYLYEGRH